MNDWERPGAGSWGRSVVLIVAAAVVLAVVARARPDAPTGRLEITQDTVPPVVAPSPASPWALPPPGTWRRLPPAPLASRVNYTMAWTGSEVIVWGGFDALNRPRLNGAAFDPVRGTWRSLPSTAARDASAIAVTAGSDVVFVSSRDTRRFNPTSRRWAAGPTLPVPAGHSIGDHIVAAGWVVVAVTEPYDRDRPSAVFALRTGAPRWERLPDIPVTMTAGHTVLAAGSRIMIFGPPVDDQPAAVTLDVDVVPATWRHFPPPPGLDGEHLITLAGIAPGNRIMLWGARADAPTGYAAIWEGGRWRLADPGPLRPSRVVSVMWTGGRMLVWDRFNNVGALLDPRTDRWTGVPQPPTAGTNLVREAVWAGSGLLVWGALGAGGAIYTPG
jgi:hypothetical protein